MTGEHDGTLPTPAAGEDEAAAPLFVFDDRIFEKTPATAAAGAPDDSFDISSGSQDAGTAGAEDDFAPASPALESHPEEKAPIFGRSLSPTSGLFGAVLLFGVVLFLFQRSDFGVRWSGGDAPPPPPPWVVAPVRIPPASLPAAAGPAKPAVSPPAPAPPAPAPAPAPSQPSPQHLVADEERRFTLAAEFLQKGDDKQAEALYRQLFGEGTQKGRAALALGDLFVGRDDFSRAEKYYRSAQLLFESATAPTSPP